MDRQRLGEFEFIARVSDGCLRHPERVLKGIGDDCAVLPGPEGLVHLVTTDLLVERVHFLRDTHTPSQIGAKAMVVNLSDIAAMGGEPLWAFVSLAVPRDLGLHELDEVYRGLKDMAARFDVDILGGDTTASAQDLIINVALIGRAEADKVLYRHGALPGDTVFVTGPLGDSALGLHVLLHGTADEGPDARELVKRHLEPRPALRIGASIAASGLAHAMIDVSDGLGADLGHILDSSHLGCRIDAAALPLSEEARSYSLRHGLDPLDAALTGGEDYVLIATGKARLAEVVPCCVPIGFLTRDPSRVLVYPDGRSEELRPRGWDHFRWWGES